LKQSKFIALSAAFAVVLLGSGQEAQAGDGTKVKSKGKTAKKSTGEVRYAVRGTGAETGLAGINLYDSGLKVLQVYGNPEAISAITVGGAAATGGGEGGPPGGFGGARGPSGGGGGAPGRPGGGGGAASPTADSILPPGLGNFELFPSDAMGDGALWKPAVGNFGQPVDVRQGTRLPPKGPGVSGGGRPPSGGGAEGVGAPQGATPGGAPAGGGNTASESTTFTRWQYTKNGTKLAFIIDKFNRVLQIEAIGLVNKNISTKRGVGFGNTFQTVMNKYAPANEPDGYDLAGSNFTIRFLTRSRVAFRLTQLGGKTPHVVTGIVVSAGKK